MNAETVKKEGEVSTSLMRLGKAINIAHENYAKLRERLSPVMCPKPSAIKTDEKVTSATPLSSEIDSRTRDVMALSDYICGALDELEL